MQTADSGPINEFMLMRQHGDLEKIPVVDYKPLHSFSSVVLYDTAICTRNRGRFFDVGRFITQAKMWTVGLSLLVEMGRKHKYYFDTVTTC